MTLDESRFRVVAYVAAAGVAAYVASWAIAGALHPDYDPTRRAISETFALGAPQPGRALMLVVLVVTGVVLVGFGWVLDRGLPGTGRAAGLASAISGVMTVGVVVVPCTQGCPGYGATFTDSAHSVVAGAGYIALVLAPLLAAWRVRGHDRRLMVVSLVLGGIAAGGLIARSAGLAPEYSGLQQRIFNTTADLWYVVVGIWLARRSAGHAPASPEHAPESIRVD